MKKILAFLLAAVLLVNLSAASAMTPAGGLTYGDKGEEVLRVQTALDRLGYNVGKLDGSYGAYTENAVRRFQKKHGLSVDGIAGTRTRELLYQLAEGVTVTAAPAPVPAVPNTGTSSVSTSSSAALTASDGSFFGGNYASIHPGSTGTRVVLLQNALLQLGYSVGKIDGKYGAKTKTAVSSFQKAQGLSADGVAGKNTLARMEALKSAGPVSVIPTTTAAPSVQAPPETTYREGTLAPGMTGSAVSELQTQLKTLGYYTKGVDGNFGSGTQAAVEQFQREHGLSVDGVAGPKTKAAIAQAVEKASAAANTSNTYRNLTVGSTGTDVTRLQTALKNLSYTVNVTGTYDAVTKAAVTAFQKRNGLTADGVAGEKTQTRVYSGSAVAAAAPTVAPAATPAPTATPKPATVTASGQSGKTATVTVGSERVTLQLLHWFNDIKPTIRSGQTILVYEPVSKISWTLRLYSLGRHADSEPLTAEDTANMLKAFGGVNTWNQKAVYVRLPSGVWTIAATHDMPHLSGSISSNNFDGHLCVHFLRTMSECEQNDPKYGVANQNTIRSTWKNLTGETISY